MIKLNELESKVIRAVQLRADEPLSAISEDTGIKVSTLRQYLRRLIDNEILKKRVLVNPYLFDHMMFRLYFRTQDGRRGEIEQLTEDLKQSEFVSHLAFVGGSYDYRFELIVPSALVLSTFIDDLFDRHPEVVKQHKVSLLRKKYLFGSKVLHANLKSKDCIRLDIEDSRDVLDATMHETLAAIAGDAFLSVRDSARVLGIPESTLTYRVKKLQESNVICGHYYSLEEDFSGLQTFYVLCLTQSAFPGEAAAFEQFCESHTNIDVMWKMMGEWEYELYIRASSQREIQELCRDFYGKFPTLLRDILVLPDFGAVKQSHYPYQKHMFS